MTAPAAPPAKEHWLTSVDAQNPLVGRVWDGRALSTREREEARLAGYTFVLLGEKHDNPDHHRLQAEALDAIVTRGRHPAVLFEMIDVDLQPSIDAYLAHHEATTEGLRIVLEWDQRGWPSWSLYQPIFDVAVRSHLPIIAASLGHGTTHAVMKGGTAGLDPALAARVARPLPAALEASLEEEIRASHCGALPETAVVPMTLVQRVKDAFMADQMLAHAQPDGAVLVAGNGHVRTDRGVPYYLRAARPDARVFAVSFVEVARGESNPSAYAAADPADVLAFTPRVDDKDPCEAFRNREK